MKQCSVSELYIRQFLKVTGLLELVLVRVRMGKSMAICSEEKRVCSYLQFIYTPLLAGFLEDVRCTTENFFH